MVEALSIGGLDRRHGARAVRLGVRPATVDLRHRVLGSGWTTTHGCLVHPLGTVAPRRARHRDRCAVSARGWTRASRVAGFDGDTRGPRGGISDDARCGRSRRSRDGRCRHAQVVVNRVLSSHPDLVTRVRASFHPPMDRPRMRSTTRRATRHYTGLERGTSATDRDRPWRAHDRDECDAGLEDSVLDEPRVRGGRRELRWQLRLWPCLS